jgi:solute carrier family 34 (sodium-dependent phosphate cotransporter)
MKSSKFKGVLTFFTILISLNLFFLSIALLGAFKGAGKEYAELLIKTLSNNQFLGLLVGILATSIMQSSSATTSIVVSFVASGLFGTDVELALYAAIPIIMGANIGTSVTNTIVAMGHIGNENEFRRATSAATVHDFFNFMVVLILFPIQASTNFMGKIAYYVAGFFVGAKGGNLTFKSPIKMLIKPQQKFFVSLFDNYKIICEFLMYAIIAYFFIVLMMELIKKVINSSKKKYIYYIVVCIYIAGSIIALKDYNSFVINSNLSIFVFALTLLFLSLGTFVNVMKGFTSGKLEVLFNNYIFKKPARSFVVGIIITILVQSSSVTTSAIIPLAGAGFLNLNQIFPYTLGANVGTTITALLAAISLGSVGALAVSFSHVLFNVIGVCIVFPLKKIPMFLARKFSDLILINRALPVILVLSVYIFIPLIFVLIFS